MIHDKPGIARFFWRGLTIGNFVGWAAFTFGKASGARAKLSAVEMHFIWRQGLQDRAGRCPSAGVVE
jgi:hypothetical protein